MKVEWLELAREELDNGYQGVTFGANVPGGCLIRYSGGSTVAYLPGVSVVIARVGKGYELDSMIPDSPPIPSRLTYP